MIYLKYNMYILRVLKERYMYFKRQECGMDYHTLWLFYFMSVVNKKYDISIQVKNINFLITIVRIEETVAEDEL